jgi:hypothetical protein
VTGRLDCDALYVALDRQRRARRMSWRAVLLDAGVKGPSLATRLGQGFPPATDNLVRMLLWLGETDLKPYIATGENP